MLAIRNAGFPVLNTSGSKKKGWLPEGSHPEREESRLTES